MGEKPSISIDRSVGDWLQPKKKNQKLRSGQSQSAKRADNKSTPQVLNAENTGFFSNFNCELF